MTLVTKSNFVVCLTLCMLSAGAIAQEHDFYKHLRYPSKLVPGVGLDEVEQTADGRRVVRWWPRKGQDIVDIPAGAPLRTCQDDPLAQGGQRLPALRPSEPLRCHKSVTVFTV